MNIDNLKLANNVEDLRLQKHITENVNRVEKELDTKIADINSMIDSIVNESSELELPIESCPSFIEFSARYSFNDTDELKTTIREFFQNNLRNKQVLIEK